MNEKKIAADVWFPIVMDELEKGKKVRFKPVGVSMYPFIIHTRDYVILEKLNKTLRKGDICVYRSEKGVYIVHSIYKIINNGKGEKEYIFLGDSLLYKEGPIKQEQILAVANSIIRKDKVYSCYSRKFRLIHNMWINLFPIRKHLIKGWFFIRKLTGEQKRDERLKEEWLRRNQEGGDA